MTVADLPLLKGVSDPQISPDGRSVAYVRTTSDYQADKITSVIVIVDAASGRDSPRDVRHRAAVVTGRPVAGTAG